HGPNGKPPMTVNSDRRVTNLNADKLDGRHAADFLPAFVYVKAWKVELPPVDELLNPSIFEVSCDAGDLQLNAGWGGLRPDTQIKDSFPINAFGWHFSVSNLGTETYEITIELTCADFEPRRANTSHPGG